MALLERNMKKAQKVTFTNQAVVSEKLYPQTLSVVRVQIICLWFILWWWFLFLFRSSKRIWESWGRGHHISHSRCVFYLGSTLGFESVSCSFSFRISEDFITDLSSVVFGNRYVEFTSSYFCSFHIITLVGQLLTQTPELKSVGFACWFPLRCFLTWFIFKTLKSLSYKPVYIKDVQLWKQPWPPTTPTSPPWKAWDGESM